MTGLDRLFDIILSMQKDITDIKEKTAVNTTNLEVHMKRTEQNEELWKMADTRLTKLENRDQLMSALWKISVSVAGLVVTVLSIIIAIRELH